MTGTDSRVSRCGEDDMLVLDHARQMCKPRGEQRAVASGESSRGDADRECAIGMDVKRGDVGGRGG